MPGRALASLREDTVGRSIVRFEENRAAGARVREFRNLDPPREGPRPGHLDLGWSTLVRQVGTRQFGGLEYVEVRYSRGKRRRRFTGALADRVLRAVQEHRSDARTGGPDIQEPA
jgi:hypothetical protein